MTRNSTSTSTKKVYGVSIGDLVEIRISTTPLRKKVCVWRKGRRKYTQSVFIGGKVVGYMRTDTFHYNFGYTDDDYPFEFYDNDAKIMLDPKKRRRYFIGD